MINIDKLADTLCNFKGRSYKLPQENKFTQRTAFQMKLDELENNYNIKLMINTSFNLNGEPIVNSLDDAIRTFYTSGLDVLIINDFYIAK